MSVVKNIVATGNIGPVNGCRVGSVSLSAGAAAAATAVLSDSGVTTTQIMSLAALQGTVSTHPFADSTEGVSISGQLSVVLAGAGASLNIELL